MNRFTFKKSARAFLLSSFVAALSVCWLVCGGDDNPNNGGGGSGLDSKLVCADGEAWVKNDDGYIFKSNGDLLQVYSGNVVWEKVGSFKWQTNGNKLTFAGVTVTYEVSNNTLKMTAGGTQEVYSKRSGVNVGGI